MTLPFGFAVCVDARGQDDLQTLKVYELMEDERAERAGLMHVIDDSGEDYLYPTERFVRLELDPRDAQALAAARSNGSDPRGQR